MENGATSKRHGNRGFVALGGEGNRPGQRRRRRALARTLRRRKPMAHRPWSPPEARVPFLDGQQRIRPRPLVSSRRGGGLHLNVRLPVDMKRNVEGPTAQGRGRDLHVSRGRNDQKLESFAFTRGGGEARAPLRRAMHGADGLSPAMKRDGRSTSKTARRAPGREDQEDKKHGSIVADAGLVVGQAPPRWYPTGSPPQHEQERAPRLLLGR